MKVAVTVTIDSEVYAEVTKYAEVLKISRSSFAQRVLEENLEGKVQVNDSRRDVIRVSMTLAPEVVRSVDAQAKRRKRSRSGIIEDILRECSRDCFSALRKEIK